MSRLCSTLSVSVRMVPPEILLDKQTHPLVLVECRLSLLQMLVLARLFNVKGVSLSYGCALSLLGAANVTGRSFERRMCVLAWRVYAQAELDSYEESLEFIEFMVAIPDDYVLTLDRCRKLRRIRPVNPN